MRAVLKEQQASEQELRAMRNLSPRRRTTVESAPEALVAEQLAHFHIDADSPYGRALGRVVGRLYECSADLDRLWRITFETIDSLDRSDKVAYFNAKKFLSFQIAKLLDNLQNPLRRTYQSLGYGLGTQAAKGPYALFDNVSAIFSATPVIARTATYIYACADWVAEAFQGKEFLEQIYSRLLNPTSLSLANYIVDLEAGPYAREYLAWNFGSGMAAIDAALSHVLGRGDVLVTARNIYGGAHQLINDWYAKPANLGIKVEHFDGVTADDFARCWQRVARDHARRLWPHAYDVNNDGNGTEQKRIQSDLSASQLRENAPADAAGAPKNGPGAPKNGPRATENASRIAPADGPRAPVTAPSPDKPHRARHAYVYLESPCNPHGYVLDVPGICRYAHARGLRVLLDATVATPFLARPLQHPDPDARPDFVIHSYSKDLSGTGQAIGGVVIGRNEDMFIPKGQSVATPRGVKSWDESLFWNVYYVKGGFLNADAAYEILQGIRTLDVRMMAKCINTIALARYLASHPDVRVRCNALPTDPNHALCRDHLFLGLPAPLFTVDLPTVPRDTFQRFFDSLDPTFAHMISLGQSNTIVSCPGLTTHSELSEQAQRDAAITPGTMRIAVGDEDVRDLIAHWIAAARGCIDPAVPGFSSRFMPPSEADRMAREVYVDVHRRYIESKPPME